MPKSAPTYLEKAADGVYEPTDEKYGITFLIAIAIQMAASHGKIHFVHDDVNVTVTPASNPLLIYRDYVRATYSRIEPDVGPYAKPTLSSADLAEDLRHEQADTYQRATRPSLRNRRGHTQLLAA